MIFIDLIQNLALLVALSLIAGFVADRTRDRPRLGVLLLGLIFGSAAVLGMLRPLTLAPGLIFDGRSVMLSLCGLFFGPAATALACAISVGFRLLQGGVGAFTGALVMLASGGVGLLFHRYCRPWERDTSASTLLLLGLITHVAMLGLMFTLPWPTAMHVLQVLGTPILITYPLATVLIGKIFADQLSRRRTLAALAESEHKYRGFIDNAPDGVFVSDAQGRYLEVNAAAQRLTGYTEAELLGMTFLDLLPPENRAAGQAHFDRLFSQGWSSEELELVCRSGARPLCMVDAVALPDGLFLGFARDITQRRLDQRALAESEEKYRRIVETAMEGIWIMDERHRTAFVNSTLADMIGYDQAEMVGRPVEDFAFPEDLETLRERLVHRHAGRSERYEHRFRRKDGGEVWTIVSATPLLDAAGRFTGSFGMFTDITERRAAERAMAEAKELAEAANRSKSEFLANMSHEIRTPLNGLMGMMQLLEGTDQTEEQREYTGIALRSGARLTALLSDILDLSRLEAGRLAIVREPFALRELADAVGETFGQQSREKGLDLRIHTDPALPTCLVGDVGRIRQVLFNLVANAMKFTDRGEVRLDISALSTPDEDPVRLLFTVSDTGIGIPDEALDRIFMPFTQVDGSFSRRHQGAGLGLTISRRLAELMGGGLSVDSVPGRGTTVYLALELAVDHAAPRPEPRTGRARVQRADQPLRLLLAEDDRTNRVAATRLLEKMGHSVLAVENGSRALEAIKAEPFDAVLMDVQMPGLSGVETTAALRRMSGLGPRAQVPVIAMTAHAMPGDRERLLASGMDGYVAKPVDAADLARVLEGIAPARPEGRDAPGESPG